MSCVLQAKEQRTDPHTLSVSTASVAPGDENTFDRNVCDPRVAAGAGLRSERELIASDGPCNSTPVCMFEYSTLVAGRFRVLRLIGRGGMGEVYESEDEAISSRPHVALKVIRPEFSSNAAATERFEREVVLSKRVTHCNVCRTHDLGFHADSTRQLVFVTMELLHGRTLSDLLSARGRMPAAQALPLIRQIGDALTAVHQAGVVHGDVKPANIMLVPVANQSFPRVVLTDFGMATAFAPHGAREELISGSRPTGGTPDYMSPEQVLGLALGPSSDIYAFGALIYKMITGKLLFDDPNAVARVHKRVNSDPLSPRKFVRDLDPAWERIILKCLSMDPGQRFTSARNVAKALQRSGAMFAESNASPDAMT
jgi:serine/threonine-protein kinase